MKPSVDSSGWPYDYIYGRGGTPSEQVSAVSGTAAYLYTDQLGSVVMEVDQSGTVTGTQSYTAYGSLASQTGTCITPFGFGDGFADATGLIYLVNRYYDSSTGQFLSVDPLMAFSGASYGYSSDDPINLNDPTGCGVCDTLLKHFYATAAVSVILSIVNGLCPAATQVTDPIDVVDGLITALTILFNGGECLAQFESADGALEEGAVRNPV